MIFISCIMKCASCNNLLVLNLTPDDLSRSNFCLRSVQSAFNLGRVEVRGLRVPFWKFRFACGMKRGRMNSKVLFHPLTLGLSPQLFITRRISPDWPWFFQGKLGKMFYTFRSNMLRAQSSRSVKNPLGWFTPLREFFNVNLAMRLSFWKLGGGRNIEDVHFRGLRLFSYRVVLLPFCLHGSSHCSPNLTCNVQ